MVKKVKEVDLKFFKNKEDALADKGYASMTIEYEQGLPPMLYKTVIKDTKEIYFMSGSTAIIRTDNLCTGIFHHEVIKRGDLEGIVYEDVYILNGTQD